MLTTLALDTMGGDHGPNVVVPAAINALHAYPELKLILVGDEFILKSLLAHENRGFERRYRIHHTTQQVAMNESPALALRNKKDSSMRVAISLVKEGQAQACVSAGNTGALVATARFVLKMLPGIDRPAIIGVLPTAKHTGVHLLDLGANIDSTPEHLYQFALMASILVTAVDNIPNPRVSLLNVGEEDIKGNELVKKTVELLINTDAINYIGFVEGDTILSGDTDIVVCDGFVGNVALKTAEGISKLMTQFTREAFEENWCTKLAAMLVMPILQRIVKRTDPERYNGATLLGLDGIVVKSHGGANVKAFTYAIEEAIVESQKNVPKLIKEHIGKILKIQKETP